MSGNNDISDELVEAKIRRALLSGPDSITREATVAEMDGQGKMTVLRPGTNQWVCVPGNENIIGQADMCADSMGMRWVLDAMARKPRPTNTEPGLIYRARSADRPPGRPGRLQPGDRRAAFHQPRHRRLPPAEGLHQARHQLA